MFWLRNGELKYIQVEQDPVYVSPGAWSCEPSLWTVWAHWGSMRAAAESCLLSLDARDFHDIATTFIRTETKFHAGLYAAAFVKALNKVVEEQSGPPTDLIMHLMDIEGMAKKIFAPPEDDD